MKRRLLLLFAVCISLAQSQPPSPRPSKSAQGNKNNEDTGKSATPPDNTSSDRLSTAIEKLTAEVEAGREQSNRDKQQAAPQVEFWNKASTITTAIAALLTLFVLVRQTRIMDRQRIATDLQAEVLQPRLHVDRVRVGNFKNGEQPIFFVRVMNSGAVAAETVLIGVNVELGSETTMYPKEQTITVPANSWREIFIRSGFILERDMLTNLNGGSVPLRVSGHFRWKGKTTNYCYKYLPWPLEQKRPRGLRRFVTCDFATGITINANIQATAAAAFVAAPSPVVNTETVTPKEPGNAT